MEQHDNLFDLQIDALSREHLLSTAKWAKFLAIVGFIFSSLMLLVGIFYMAFDSQLLSQTNAPFGGQIIGTVYITIAILNFPPCLYLYRFAVRIQNALTSMNQGLVPDAFSQLKSCYKFLGILMIVVLSLYMLAIIFTIIAGVAFSGL